MKKGKERVVVQGILERAMEEELWRASNCPRDDEMKIRYRQVAEDAEAIKACGLGTHRTREVCKEALALSRPESGKTYRVKREMTVSRFEAGDPGAKSDPPLTEKEKNIVGVASKLSAGELGEWVGVGEIEGKGYFPIYRLKKSLLAGRAWRDSRLGSSSQLNAYLLVLE